jgi:hypothetical protein
MSMRTKNPCAAAGRHDAPQVVVQARDPTSSPSCVSFSEMFRSMPEATMRSMMRRYSAVAASASSVVVTLSPR